MNLNDNSSNDSLAPAIRRGRLENLAIYEISEAELNTLEKGSPESIYLNISIALISLALAFLSSLLVTEIKAEMTLIFFIFFVVIGFVVGGVLLILWFRSRSSVDECIESIRKRLPPEGEMATLRQSDHDSFKKNQS